MRGEFIMNRLIIYFCSILMGPAAFANLVEDWIEQAKPIFFEEMVQNISPTGTYPGIVIASPSRQLPNYYFYWVRDGSLVIDLIVNQYAEEQDLQRKGDFGLMLWDFVNLTALNQRVPNLSNGPGEPKFEVDGSPFNGEWGRPQNDGPALRAITLIHFAKILLKEGEGAKVSQRLYNEKPNSVIKYDLEFISNHWNDTCFDLWEETKGRHFYTQVVQRSALLQGAWLAREMGDFGAAAWYERQAEHIKFALGRYYEERRGILGATIDRNGGADYKYSNLDSAIVLGMLHSQPHEESDGFLALASPAVLRTVQTLENEFRNLYEINKHEYPGIAIGRYPEDRYNGQGIRTHGRPDGGNPWFLTTAAFAEYYYLLANELSKHGPNAINSRNIWFFKSFGYEEGTPIEPLARALISYGDQFLSRIKIHSQDNHLSEQFNRTTGFMQGARDLTWSYASLLTAIRAR